MDDQRFDNLVRAMARGGSRRRVLKGLAAGLGAGLAGWAGVGRSIAQTSVPLGGICTDTNQCAQPGNGAVRCADNGLSVDGPLNCCKDLAGACTDGAQCCGGLKCNGGVCNTGSSLLPPGSTCTSGAQCAQPGTGGFVCADNGYGPDGALNCCHLQGGSCDPALGSVDCCGSFVCTNGFCGGSVSPPPPPPPPPPTGTVALGGVCAITADCAQPTGGAVICADNSVASDGALNCCRSQGGACTAGTNCCGGLQCTSGICGGTVPPPPPGGLVPGAVCTVTTECSQTGGTTVCADNGIAGDGTLNCCRNQGGACSGGAGCCGALLCTNGVCGGTVPPPPPTGTLLPGAVCSVTTECSQAGGATVCADNGLVDDGPLNCCRNQGGACSGGAGCCGALLCTNGVCGGTAPPPPPGGLVPGAVCTATSECSQAGGATVCADNGLTFDGSLNCCRNQGGACAGGTGCCGALECVGGVCGGSVSPPPPPTGGLAPGAVCTATAECSQSGGTTVCADNGLTGDGPLNCCRNQGGACTGGAGCCAALECVGGVCGGSVSPPPPPGGGSLGVGQACSSAAECAQPAGAGAVVCGNNGLSFDGALNCCRFQGGACTTGSHCCEALECRSGTCQP